MDEIRAIATEFVRSAQNLVEPEPLSIEQERAVLLILTGVPDQVVADEVGVTRSTVSRWRNGNPAFRLALETARRQQFQSMRDRLQGLAEKAIDVIEDHLAENNLQAAVAVLKGCGLSDQRVIQREMEDRERFLNEAEETALLRVFRQELKNYYHEAEERFREKE